jgi:hypothetical protein
MPKFIIEKTMVFRGEIEAPNAKEAKRLADEEAYDASFEYARRSYTAKKSADQ